MDEAARHRPTVVPCEERLQHEREGSKDRLLRTQPPIEPDMGLRTVLLEGPHPRAVEIAGRSNLEPGRWIDANGLGRPTERVGKPAARMKEELRSDLAAVGRTLDTG